MKHGVTRRFLALFFAAALCLSAAGCGKKDGNVLRVDLAGKLKTLDPQMAVGVLSDCILENSMEGLLRRLPDGTLTEGVAESYSSFQNGMEFRFSLRTDALWSDGTPLTARDFLFAFQRIFRGDAGPDTAERFSAIENGWEIYQGLLPMEELGVRVVDDRTLTITLGKPDPFFLEKLGEPAALPCNEEYFSSTHSRYGNTLDYFLFSGPYVVSEWTKDLIRLKPNEQYHGKFPARNTGVLCYLGREDPVKKFLSGETDFYEVDHDTALSLPTAVTTLVTFQNGMVDLVFNREEGSLTANRELRRALCLALDMPEFVESERLPERYEYTLSLAPDSAQVFNENYHDLTRKGFRLGEVVYEETDAAGNIKEEPVNDFRYSNQLGFIYHLSDAKAALLDSGLEAPAGLTILIEEGSDLMEFAGWLQKQWHEHLGLIVNLESVPTDVFSARMQAGEYTIALVSYTADSNLNSFFRGILSGQAPFRYDTPRFRQLLSKAEKADDVEEAVRYYASAEAMLFDEVAAMPLFSGSSYFAMGDGVKGIQVSSDGHHLFFAGATRE